MSALPDVVTSMVGQRIVWREDRPTVIDGEASLLPTEEAGLVLGARWARNVDGRAYGLPIGLVQFLMERPDGTSRWTGAVALQELQR